MLCSVNGKEITGIPRRRQADFNAWRRNLSNEDYENVIRNLHQVFDEAIESGQAREQNGIVTSSYIPGRDWTNTPYQPIYEACGENFDQARLFFGLLVWDAVIQHENNWIFIRQERDSDHPLGMTYFIGDV